MTAPAAHYPMLFAYVTENTAVRPEILLSFLQEQLPQYMIPASIQVLDTLPRTPNGKVDRNALPIPELKTTDEYIAPRNEVEEKLVQIWEKILVMIPTLMRMNLKKSSSKKASTIR